MIRKYFRLLPIVTLLLLSSLAYGQGGRSPVNDVLNAMRTNRVEEIGRYFDNFVPVTINSNQSNYSHNQAELVLRDFFDRNPPRDFKIMDISSAGPNSQFGIAVFNTASGRYGVYVLIKQTGGNYFIKEIRINRE
jgi:hypothetical protein